jgi:hypothetical protein
MGVDAMRWWGNMTTAEVEAVLAAAYAASDAMFMIRYGRRIGGMPP